MPLEPSAEATQLADLAADTLLAFERKFRGLISWAADMPGLVTSVESNRNQESLLLQLLVKAYEERARDAMSEKAEARRKKDRPDFEAVLRQMERTAEGLVPGPKRVHADDPKVQRELAAESDAFLRRIGLEPTGRTIYGPLPSPGAEAEPALPSPDSTGAEPSEGGTDKPATRATTGGDEGEGSG